MQRHSRVIKMFESFGTYQREILKKLNAEEFIKSKTAKLDLLLAENFFFSLSLDTLDLRIPKTLFNDPVLAGIQRKIASLVNIHDITVCLIGRPEKYHLLLYPASLCSVPPRLKFVIHISFGRNFGTNAQKLYYFYKRFLQICRWFSFEYSPSFCLRPDCLLERTLSLVLVVKMQKESLLGQILLILKNCHSKFRSLPSWQTLSPKLEPSQASMAHSKPLSQHPMPCHSVSSVRKASHATKSLLAKYSTCLEN